MHIATAITILRSISVRRQRDSGGCVIVAVWSSCSLSLPRLHACFPVCPCLRAAAGELRRALDPGRRRARVWDSPRAWRAIVCGLASTVPVFLTSCRAIREAVDDVRTLERLESDGKRLASDTAAGAKQAALDRLQSAWLLWRELDDRSGQATARARMGDIHHARGQFDEAETAYKEALELIDRREHPYQFAVIHNNLGVGDGRRGRLQEAGAHFQQALDLWRSLSLPEAEAATLVNEGSVFFESGAYRDALARFLPALPIFEEGTDAQASLLLNNNIGVLYWALGDLDAAREYLRRALARAGVDDGSARARALVRLGQVSLEQRDMESADTSVQEALAIARRVDDPVVEADALDLIGQIAVASGRHEAALDFFKHAHSLYARADARRGVATALHHIGVAVNVLGNVAEARQALTRALTIREQVGLRDAEAETRYELGRVEWNAGSMSAAVRHLRAAVDLIEDVRGRVAGEYSRTTYFAARRKYFATYIDVLMQLHDQQPSRGYAVEAFETSERERAR